LTAELPSKLLSWYHDPISNQWTLFVDQPTQTPHDQPVLKQHTDNKSVTLSCIMTTVYFYSKYKKTSKIFFYLWIHLAIFNMQPSRSFISSTHCTNSEIYWANYRENKEWGRRQWIFVKWKEPKYSQTWQLLQNIRQLRIQSMLQFPDFQSEFCLLLLVALKQVFFSFYYLFQLTHLSFQQFNSLLFIS